MTWWRLGTLKSTDTASATHSRLSINGFLWNIRYIMINNSQFWWRPHGWHSILVSNHDRTLRAKIRYNLPNKMASNLMRLSPSLVIFAIAWRSFSISTCRLLNKINFHPITLINVELPTIRWAINYWHGYTLAVSKKTDTKLNSSTFYGTVPQKMEQFHNLWNSVPKMWNSSSWKWNRYKKQWRKSKIACYFRI